IKYATVLNIQNSVWVIVVLIQTIPQLITGHLSLGASILFGLLGGAFLFAGVVSFRNMSVLHMVRQRLARLSLFLLALVCSMVLATFLSAQRTLDGTAIMHAMGFGWAALLASLSLIAITVARRTRIKALDIRLSHLLEAMEALVRSRYVPVHPRARHPSRSVILTV